MISAYFFTGDLPKRAFGSNAEVLQDKPDARLVRSVIQTKGTDRDAADEIPGKHSPGLRSA